MLKMFGLGMSGILFLCGCSLPDLNLMEYKETRAYLGTNVTIRCFFDPQKDISLPIRNCWEKMEQIQQEINVYSETGDLAEINRSGFNGVAVHKETYRLIKDSLEFSRLSQGAFDITVFPLVELWKEAAVKGRLPHKEALAAAKGKVGYQNIRLQEPNRVFVGKKGMKLDLGAIVSGYACDEIATILDASGIKNFLIDTGGEILCRGKESGKKPWMIGVLNPMDKNKVLIAIKLGDKSISTSGSYEKFHTIEGVRFSHIIDPISGYPQKNAISATVIAKTGKEADSLSTILCVLGGKKGVELIKSLKGVQAMIVESRNGQLHTYKTGNFK